MRAYLANFWLLVGLVTLERGLVNARIGAVECVVDAERDGHLLVVVLLGEGDVGSVGLGREAAHRRQLLARLVLGLDLFGQKRRKILEHYKHAHTHNLA